MHLLFLLEKLQNLGQRCWQQCQNDSSAIGSKGPCEFCGTEGFCCRRSGNQVNGKINGCDGFMGGLNNHECAEIIPGMMTFEVRASLFVHIIS